VGYRSQLNRQKVTSKTWSRQGRRKATAPYLFLQLPSGNFRDEVGVVTQLDNRIISPSVLVSFRVLVTRQSFG